MKPPATTPHLYSDWEMGTLGKAFYTVGFWIRETGQAIDRLGSRLQGNYFFQEQRTFHSHSILRIFIHFSTLYYCLYLFHLLNQLTISFIHFYIFCIIRVLNWNWNTLFCKLLCKLLIRVSIHIQCPGIDLWWMYSTKLLMFIRMHLSPLVLPSLVMFRLVNLHPFGMDVFSEVNSLVPFNSVIPYFFRYITWFSFHWNWNPPIFLLSLFCFWVLIVINWTRLGFRIHVRFYFSFVINMVWLNTWLDNHIEI